MVLQANFVLAFVHVFGSNRSIAGADRVELVYEFKHCVGCIGKTVRTEVLSAKFVFLACLEYPRISLFGDADVRIALAVL